MRIPFLASRDEGSLPLHMLDEPTAAEVMATQRQLEALYHRGQERIWEGRAALAAALHKHGGVQLDDARADAIRNLFAVVLWGELATWKISAALAERLEPLGAKMAATAQVHDEARHFYVLRDYLMHVGRIPRALPPRTTRTLTRLLRANHLAKMLVGRQLVIEPLARTLSSLVRARRVEPVLCEILAMYERDEARRLGLGAVYLPVLLKRMGIVEKADLAAWQLRESLLQRDMLRELEPDLRTLGIDPRRALSLARNEQLVATRVLEEELGRKLTLSDWFLRVADFKTGLRPPDGARRGDLRGRFSRAFRAARDGHDTHDTYDGRARTDAELR